ncbi:IS110 family transposase, partial [Bacillus thuringiensis]
MYYIGIDIAKFKHYASIIDQTGKTLTKPISFQNHTEG